MGEKDFLVDAVAQFLQTSEWQDAITQFFAAHHAQFPGESTDEKQSKGVGYSLEQYDVFTQFKELMERLLETMMGELGCSGEDLVAILHESVLNGPTGERRFLIKTLLSFDDYEDFYARITEFAAQQPPCTNDNEYSAERSEWEMQLAVAQSLLDANAQGLLDEGEQSFLPWAEALVGMGQSNSDYAQASEISSESKDDSASGAIAEIQNEADERLKELEYTLIKERLKVDLLVAQRIAEANSAMKKDMLHLSATNVFQSEDQEAASTEQSLEALFAQLETVRDRLKVVKARCFEFKSVSQEAMDKMYLFLKEKVHFQQDLVSHEREIADFIFALIDQSDAPLIPLLLEWLLLESEALRVQGQIQEELGQGGVDSSVCGNGGDGFWMQSWDENAQAFFYFHSVTGESVWAPPSEGFYDANQEYQWADPTQSDSCDAKDAAENAREYASDSNATTSLYQAAVVLEEKMGERSTHNAADVLEMDRELERISKEHDEERMRLELVFEVEKARQKEDLRRRKEKKRREKHLKKKTKDGPRNDRVDEVDGSENDVADKRERNDDARPVEPLPTVPSPRMLTGRKAEAKTDDGNESHMSIQIPGRCRLDLAHLLSETHAKRQLQKNGLAVPLAPAPQALLNPTSLRYLAETLAKKNVGGWLDDSPKSASQLPPPDIVLEEADEK